MLLRGQHDEDLGMAIGCNNEELSGDLGKNILAVVEGMGGQGAMKS